MNDTQRMVRATRRARNKTTLGQLENLVRQRTVWTRKETVARNKLAEVNRAITRIATQYAEERFNDDLLR